MATPSQVDELEAKINELREDIKELEEAYGLNEEEGETVEVPAGGRTNWERGLTESFETDEKEPKTITEQIHVPAGGRSNHEQGNGEAVEREVPVDDGMDTLEWRETLNQSMAEEEQERVNQRKEAYERHIEDKDREVDPENVPAGGRSNWEARQED